MMPPSKTQKISSSGDASSTARNATKGPKSTQKGGFEKGGGIDETKKILRERAGSSLYQAITAVARVQFKFQISQKIAELPNGKNSTKKLSWLTLQFNEECAEFRKKVKDGIFKKLTVCLRSRKNMVSRVLGSEFMIARIIIYTSILELISAFSV
uniref:Uncharacterized protein n=1 Tax=Solanum lycopersicum TaxID=4081 RepID=A0A3Q7EQ37_SOLLC